MIAVMTSAPKKLGAKGEKIAAKLLKKNGYKILQRNYVCKYGEIDIVAYDHGVLIFVEVKTRTSDDFGRPQEAVTHSKKRQIARTAFYYLREKGLESPDCRFDVVAISISEGGKKTDVELFKGAFSIDGLWRR